VDLSEFTKRLRESIRKRLLGLDPDIGAPDLAKLLEEALKKELKAALKRMLRNADEAKVDEVVEKLMNGEPLDDVWGFTLATDEDGAIGFTNRAGENFKWPTVEVRINPSAEKVVSWGDIDLKAIGAQLLRVFLEAVFDAQLGVPGAPSATGVGLPAEYRLPTFEPVDANQAGVTLAEFNSLNDWSGRAEGIAGSGIGQLIRGIGWISLNNEALASLIETAVGVTVRKLVEAALWERYQDDAPDVENAFAASRGGFVTIDFTFTDLSRPADGGEGN
jgi:hypothetical protein